MRIERGPRRSVWGWLLPLLLVVMLAFVAAFIWLRPMLEQMHFPTGDDRSAHLVIEELKLEVTELREKNTELERELAFVKRSSLIDKEANSDLTQSLADQQKHVLQTTEELNFYKNIVSEDNGSQAVSIRSFDITKSAQSDLFKFKLVVTRSGAKKKTIKGNLELRVQGKQGDLSKTLDWKKIRANKKKSLAFSFQYFQTIERDLRFPQGFVPENVLVKVVPSGKLESVQQSYSWNSVVKEVN